MQCPLYALPSDVARAGLSPQKAYTELIRGMAHVYRSALGGARDAQRRAQSIVSLCVGGMVLARTTHDAALRKSLRTAARHQALKLLEVRT
jgi:TetR/AcrR family transcriptional repressor of nem operon